jgi:hypothetical protein
MESRQIKGIISGNNTNKIRSTKNRINRKWKWTGRTAMEHYKTGCNWSCNRNKWWREKNKQWMVWGGMERGHKEKKWGYPTHVTENKTDIW